MDDDDVAELLAAEEVDLLGRRDVRAPVATFRKEVDSGRQDSAHLSDAGLIAETVQARCRASLSTTYRPGVTICSCLSILTSASLGLVWSRYLRPSVWRESENVRRLKQDQDAR